MSILPNMDEFVLKSEDAVDGDNPVTAALADLTKTVADKLAALETKSDKLAARVDATEIKLARPAVITDVKSADDTAKAAFDHYLRTGEKSLLDTKALNSTNGGVLIPESYERVLDKNLVEYSPVRSYARVSKLATNEIVLPKRTAGLTGGWVTETGSRPTSTATYGSQTVKLYEVGVYCDFSNRMLEDSAFDLESEVGRDFGEEFGRIESEAFLNGLGDASNQPKGLLTETSVTTLVTETVGVIKPDDMIGAYHDLPGFYAQNSVWVMNRKTIAAVRKFKNADGDYLWTDALTANNPNTFLGRPVVEMVEMPDVAADEIAIVFGDFSHFRIFDHVNTRVPLRDPYSLAVNGQTRIHASRRVGAALTKAEAFRFLKVKAS